MVGTHKGHMSGSAISFNLATFLALTQEQRKKAVGTISRARALGLVAIDGVGGGILWVGTQAERDTVLASGPVPMPGSRAGTRW